MKNTRQKWEQLCGGQIDIRLVMPTNCGSLPRWSASMPYWPSMGPVEFAANDDGGNALINAAGSAIRNWQIENEYD